MMDVSFRVELRKLLEQDDDKKIIIFVLNHIKEQWSTAFVFWLLRLQRDYDIF
jgi:hypothetical protein